MITFEGRQQLFKNADMIERKARVTYPHISGSKLDFRYHEAHHVTKLAFKPLPEFIQNIALEINKMRHRLSSSLYYHVDLVKEIKNTKVGNCFEDAMLTELIGHINGQSNIHMGNIFVKKQNSRGQKNIGHSVAFITDKNISIDGDYILKNKEAVIIDPWLNIVDFAGNYFTKIRNQYKNYFENLPNQDFLEYLIGADSKNVKEFREYKKNSCQHLTFSIKPAHSILWYKEREDYYKSLLPELVIDNYQKINLPIKKKLKPKTAKADKIA